MTFRAEGNSVLRDLDGEDVGYAMAFSPNAAQQIADALNDSPAAAGRGVKDPLTGKRVAQLDVDDSRALADVVTDGSYVKIVGPYATAKMDTPGGKQIRALAAGSILPGDVTAGAARHLIDVGLAQLVQADSALEAYEGAPTERHRVEMADPDVTGPTVLTPAPGSPAARYDKDPIAAAQAAANGVQPTLVQLSGAGEAFGAAQASEASIGEPSDREIVGGRPRSNASREAWAAYAATREAPESETAPVDQGGLSRDELRAKYGS